MLLSLPQPTPGDSELLGSNTPKLKECAPLVPLKTAVLGGTMLLSLPLQEAGWWQWTQLGAIPTSNVMGEYLDRMAITTGHLLVQQMHRQHLYIQ